MTCIFVVCPANSNPKEVRKGKLPFGGAGLLSQPSRNGESFSDVVLDIKYNPSSQRQFYFSVLSYIQSIVVGWFNFNPYSISICPNLWGV